jgi:hypothetical protein
MEIRMNYTPRSASQTLIVVVEPDLEEEWDPPEFVVVLACEGTPPEELGAGFLHAAGCACRKPGALCDVGWLEEHVRCVGVAALLPEDVLRSYTNVLRAAYYAGLPRKLCRGDFKRATLTGRMIAERYGDEFDERFDVSHVELQR